MRLGAPQGIVSIDDIKGNEAQLEPKELNKYWKAAKEQGWELETTKKGYNFVPPDKFKPKVNAHKTPSARSWERDFLRFMKRSDFIWPWPPKKAGGK